MTSRTKTKPQKEAAQKTKLKFKVKLGEAPRQEELALEYEEEEEGKEACAPKHRHPHEAPPKPILPSFVNLRALERFPYSSFDDDSSHARKRRRVDVQADSFGEHLQLPIPQSQKEQRPPPFGPFAILNGLNEPPPNAAQSEIDRYCVMPGQACAYKVGHTVIARLRQQAEAQAGFDLRDFHDAVLRNGSMPLAVLERVVAG